MYVIIFGETWLNNNLNFHLNSNKTINSLDVLNKSNGVAVFIRKKCNIINNNDHCLGK